MLTETNIELLTHLWRQKVAAHRSSPEQSVYTRRFFQSLGRGKSMSDGQMPISFRPTPYRISVGDSVFYGRTALACLHLPALLGETVYLESLCPANGSAIQLSVNQEGVSACDPPGCVISVPVPGTAPGCSLDGEDEPYSSVHQLTRFFSSAEAASLWLVPYPGVVVLAIDQAWRLVNEIYGDRSL